MTERTEQDASDWVRPAEAARQLSLHTRTLTRMAQRRQLESMTLPSGHHRYSQASIDAVKTGATA